MKGMGLMGRMGLMLALLLVGLPAVAQPFLRGPLTTNSPAIKGALDGGLLDAATNNFFRVPVGVNTNLVVTNIGLGQVIRVELFVTNGFTATFVQETASNTTAGFAVTLSSNAWQTVYISRPDTAVTNFDFRSGSVSGKGSFITNANGGVTFIQRAAPFALWNWTNNVTITNTLAATSAITNGVDNVMTLPAGFWTMGKTLTFRAEGYMSSISATPTTFAVQWNSTMLASNIVALPITLVNDFWFIEFTVRCATNSATGALFGSGKIAWQASAGSVTSVLPRRMQNGTFASPAITDTMAAGTIDLLITPGATTHSFTLVNANAAVSP